ncbi:hypothetical protein [Cerasicoccus arenae]|uniref:Uncharacterized protein n=1 Tax=Cerasicoccus arenae TaxID=424488 RepID=A0A8J3DGZ9_9BACT|nr:hypothetical protein [Cerasicoccus arenae]MBK1857022.1 hypothetical protein [Cerasicoccus arenae]GHB91911.1 hypothetical protein GCM10007047_03540 [Cerasicoccus arenae]
MRRSLHFFLFWLFSTTVALSTPLAEYTVTEVLGRNYGPELIHFPLNANPSSTSSLIGPQGPIPYQISGEDIWFVTAPLSASESSTYNLVDKPAAKPTTPQLSVNRTTSSIEISTGLISARLPLGQGNATPPPPLLGLRLGTGEWSPPSEWQNPQLIKQWSSSILEEGPVYIKTRISYELTDQTLASFTATIIAGDSAIRWRMAVSGNNPDTKLVFALPNVFNVQRVTLPKGYGQWAKQDRQLQTTSAANGFLQLSPNTSLLGLFPDHPSHVVFTNGQTTLELSSSKPGDWVSPPSPQTYFGQQQWSLPMIEQMWVGWRERGMPVVYGKNGAISLIADFARGAREWRISNAPPLIGDQLAHIQSLNLDWAETAQHPLLFLNAAEITLANQNQPSSQLGNQWASAAVAIGQPKGITDRAGKAIAQLSKQLSLLGNFDVMRQGIATAGLYDTLIDSGSLSAKQRNLFRAQMAYLGYVLADPMCWSSERGYGSGNPNMHCSYILTLGVVACVLRDHPMADTWANYAGDWLDHWLTAEVGSAGEWIPEGSHYGNVSLEVIISFAIASQRAGYRDFTNDSRLKKLISFFARMHTPPDPKRGDKRATAAYGRGIAAEQLATIGIAARMTAKSDPDFSAEMQWSWAQSGYPAQIGDFRLSGLAGYYLDRNLPQSPPKWGSENFPQFGTVFRAAFNTPQESFVNILTGVGSERNLDIWTPSVTDIAQWYALGKPLSTSFTILAGTKDRHELLSEGVQLARNYQPGNNGLPFGYYSTTHFSAFASLPGLDYTRTSRTNTKRDDRNWLPPDLPAYPQINEAQSGQLTVDRQFLFMREENPEAPAYLVVRDTTSGGEPTVWQFWTLSNGLFTSNEASLGKQLGDSTQPAHQLPSGDHYTALGQYGVDLEYFIASPQGTPRHTLRYGGDVQHEKNHKQFQDLMHLQLPHDGSYFLALFPRFNDHPAPTFSTDESRRIIRVDLPQGRDYAFLSDQNEKASMDEVTFGGTAGAAKERGAERELILGAPGQVQLGKLKLEGDFPTVLKVTQGRLMVSTTDDCPGGSVKIVAPGQWSRIKARKGPAAFKNSIELQLPAGESQYIYEAR